MEENEKDVWKAREGGGAFGKGDVKNWDVIGKPFRWKTSLEVDEEGSIWEHWEEGYELNGVVLWSMTGIDIEPHPSVIERAIEKTRER